MNSRCPCCASAPGAHTCDPDCGGCSDDPRLVQGFVHPTHAAGPGFVHPTHAAYVATSEPDEVPPRGVVDVATGTYVEVIDKFTTEEERARDGLPAALTPTPGHLVGAFGRNVLDAVMSRASRCAALVVEIIAPVAARPELGVDALTFALWKAEPETLKLPTAPDAILARPARERAEYRAAVQFVLDTGADLAVGHHTNEDVRTFLKNVRDWL